jgi:cytochrome P450/NADPH-cytochrome P450 reductase
MVTQMEPVAIPAPPGLPFLGNLLSLDTRNPIESLMAMGREHGPIFRLALPGDERIVVWGADLVDELCDDLVTDKNIAGGLAQMRKWGNDGLFTAWTYEPAWQKAHNVLLPNFSLQAMRRYLPQMVDVALQLVQKWERLNPDDVVDVSGDMTRLTFDTIGLAGFNYRLNSFYRDTPHPFVAAVLRTLEAAQTRSRQLEIQSLLDRKTETQRHADAVFMRQWIGQIIDERRAAGSGVAQDLLGCMLDGVDPKSGEKLDDENIYRQCVTFLTAGHETTSGLLSFAIYFLLKHPEVMARAREEADRVLGTDPRALPTYEQVHRLTYVTQVLNETLRHWPTAPGFQRYPLHDMILGGKYYLPKGTSILVLSPLLHRDPSVWGEDAEAFNPNRFAPERQSKVPWRAFKPFGHGQRACIGRQFAMQEAALVLGMILQRFDLIDHLDYQLEIRMRLTIKPEGLKIKVRPRQDRPPAPAVALADPPVLAPASPNGVAAPVTISPAMAPPAACPFAQAAAAPTVPAAERHNTPLLVLYGSNLGTAEGIAREIAADGLNRGYAVTVDPLDDHAEALPTEGAVIVVTASYNGNPPDNAVAFCRRLRDPDLAANAFAGVRYAVFGCGHRDWAATYQAIPTIIDTALSAHGAERIYSRGEGDARDSFDDQYRAWYGRLWGTIGETFSLNGQAEDLRPTEPRLQLAFVNRRANSAAVTSYDARAMTVRANRELQNRAGERPSERSTRHLEIALPAGVGYTTGDHLGVLPRNGLEEIRRVLLRFKLDPGTYLTISSSAATRSHLPLGETVPLLEVLSSYVELQDVPSRTQIATLAEHADDPGERALLQSLTGDDPESGARYRYQVAARRASLLDLLEEYPSCELPFAAYLEMLPPLRPRFYSISSSPLVHPEACSITVGVVEGEARSGRGIFRGTCSSYLAGLPLNGTVFAFVRKPSIPFRPPANPHIPMIMVGPGTGLAPFRGFLQERGALKRQGVPVGASMLFFGCRDEQQDFLYADELRAFETDGLTRLHTAFSRVPGQPKRYVQHLIAEQAEEVWRLIQEGALIYVCGDAARMAPDVRQAFAEIFRERVGSPDADAWLTGLIDSGRYLEDIWGGSAGA